ncbi:MAG TPA: GNAT family protein [Gammaproteobacteria bacterium]|jgi:RimJ/RimL family protein N-acetyltransferase|nr:GNAT family protein [Gammaproteobacteria bacterium]
MNLFDTPSITLKSRHIQLEPLQESHRVELYAAAQNENIWTYYPFNLIQEKFHVWFDKAIQGSIQKAEIPFAVRRLSDMQILGSTRFYDVHPKHRRLTIGNTWYVPEVWGSYVNPECKFLLLNTAFDTFDMNRVELLIDSRNTRSRAAVKKLGATEEGLLRKHMILENGYVRDTVVFSIIKSDWLNIKSLLQTRLETYV